MAVLSVASFGAAGPLACNDSAALDCVDMGKCSGELADGGTEGTSDAFPDVIVPPGCDLSKSPKDSAPCVDNAVGVFVAPSGDDGAPGTKELPLKTIGKGVELAASRGLPRVYVCEGSYDTNVEIKSPVSVYGGLSCSWTPSDAKPRLAPAKGIALRMTKVSGAVLVEDVDVVGSTDPNTPGDSAIAAFVSESANVTFRNVTLTAGNAVAGAKGASRSNYTGMNATKGGDASGMIGGVGPTCTCVDGSTSTGGTGGSATGAGLTDGSSNPAVGTANSGASLASSCDPGRPGANGLAGGAGQLASNAGALSAQGWSNADAATPAPNGRPAQGGGGGGTKLNSSSPGGAGGCGGCGGAGGASGQPGGSSFALLSFNSVVSIDGGTLTSGAGGTGGAGGAGQDGQNGGAPGTGLACDGGGGGHGAGGSGGGGASGGHSVPIGFVGTEPHVTGATLTPGTKGTGGSGGAAGTGPGNPGAAGTPGPDGKSQNTLAL